MSDSWAVGGGGGGARERGGHHSKEMTGVGGPVLLLGGLLRAKITREQGGGGGTRHARAHARWPTQPKPKPQHHRSLCPMRCPRPLSPPSPLSRTWCSMPPHHQPQCPSALLLRTCTFSLCRWYSKMGEGRWYPTVSRAGWQAGRRVSLVRRSAPPSAHVAAMGMSEGMILSRGRSGGMLG